MGKPGARKKRAYPRKKPTLLWVALAVSGVAFVLFHSWPKIYSPLTAPESSSLSSESSSAPLPKHDVKTGSAAEAPEPSAVSPALEGNAESEAGGPPSLPKVLEKTIETTSNPEAVMEWQLKGRSAPSLRTAFTDLFALWGMTFPAFEPSACSYAVGSGLKCLFKKGSLDDLYGYNRPAVMEMLSDDNVQFSATLIRFDGQNATLMVAGRPSSTTAEQIAQHWSGRFIMLWKPPPGYRGSIRPGAKGEDADWLSARLAEIGDQAVMTGPASSADLTRRVKDFQSMVGLEPDGIVGVKTIIQLNSWTDEKIPQLHGKVH